jgi:hypothetical protein
MKRVNETPFFTPWTFSSPTVYAGYATWFLIGSFVSSGNLSTMERMQQNTAIGYDLTVFEGRDFLRKNGKRNSVTP